MCRLLAFVTLLSVAAASTLNVGTFYPTGLLAVAQQENFFTTAGVNVNMSIVAGSVAAFGGLANGDIDALIAGVDNVVNRDFNRIANITVLAGFDLGPDYLLAGTNGVKSIKDIRGKSVLVDAANSGFAALIQRILLNNGLVLNTDYTFAAYGGTPFRYSALLNGSTPTGQTVYATLLTFPYTSDLLSKGRSDISILARASDYVAPYQADTLVVLTSTLSDPVKVEKITRFLEGYYLAYVFANNSFNQAAIIKDLQSYIGLSLVSAQAGYNVMVNKVSGEVVLDLYASAQGLINVVSLRQQFNGFSYPANYTEATLIVQQGGRFLNYSALQDAQNRAQRYISTGADPRLVSTKCPISINQTCSRNSVCTLVITNFGSSSAQPTLVGTLGYPLVPGMNCLLPGGRLGCAPPAIAALSSATFSYISLGGRAYPWTVQC